jgi:hypothetical protein
MRVVYRDQLTTDERKDIEKRHGGHHHHAGHFWSGFRDYQLGRYRCPWPKDSPTGKAWDAGTEAAMRLHWDRWRCPYARDDLDTRQMCRGLEAGIERMKQQGTLPPRRPRPCELRPTF